MFNPCGHVEVRCFMYMKFSSAFEARFLELNGHLFYCHCETFSKKTFEKIHSYLEKCALDLLGSNFTGSLRLFFKYENLRSRLRSSQSQDPMEKRNNLKPLQASLRVLADFEETHHLKNRSRNNWRTFCKNNFKRK